VHGSIPTRFLLLAALCLAGCERNEIKVYSVPKEQSPANPMAAMGAPAGGAQPEGMASSAPQLRWKTPDGWKVGAPSEFRVASFHIKGTGGKDADVSVIPLPGGAGGDFSNVNRWRNQVGIEPVSEMEFAALGEPVEIAGESAKLYDAAGDSLHILASVQRRGEAAWFFKMTGDPDLVAQQKPAFIEFLKSVRFLNAEPAMPAGHPDMGAMAAGMPAEATPGPQAGGPQWNVPAGWTEAPAGQFLFAKYSIEGGKAAVNISTSPGDGGGVAANVNRWRKQLGLAGELAGDDLAKSIKTINDVAFIEISGTDAKRGQAAELVGAIVLRPRQAWFYKLMGDPAVVAAQRAAFTKFVQEAKY
jgi:hypothetical protein